MKLHDPQRPTLNGRLCYLNGWTVIQPLSVWPHPDGGVELSVMLPIQGEGFAAKWFRSWIPSHSLLIRQLEYFENNPELTLENIFAADPFKPNLRKAITESKNGLRPRVESNPEPDLSELSEIET